MKRAEKKEMQVMEDLTRDHQGDSIENFKRRHALLFFERILDVKKENNFVFITRTKAKSR